MCLSVPPAALMMHCISGNTASPLRSGDVGCANRFMEGWEPLAQGSPLKQEDPTTFSPYLQEIVHGLLDQITSYHCQHARRH